VRVVDDLLNRRQSGHRAIAHPNNPAPALHDRFDSELVARDVRVESVLQLFVERLESGRAYVQAHVPRVLRNPKRRKPPLPGAYFLFSQFKKGPASRPLPGAGYVRIRFPEVPFGTVEPTLEEQILASVPKLLARQLEILRAVGDSEILLPHLDQVSVTRALRRRPDQAEHSIGCSLEDVALYIDA